MARPGTGQVVVRERRAGRLFALRFRAYGNREYVTLGMDAEGWTQQRAEVELQNVLADVRRGVWRPPHPEPAPPPVADPTFHEFASEWWASKRDELGRKTQIDYEWQLSNHLLPFFADHRLSKITIREVDRYRAMKVAEAQRRAEAIKAAGDDERKLQRARELPGSRRRRSTRRSRGWDRSSRSPSSTSCSRATRRAGRAGA
jgi:integrase